MVKKTLSYVLILLVTNLACFSAAYAQQDEKLAAQIKNAAIENGIGHNAKVVVKLFDGQKIKGYMDEIKNDRFIVVQEKTNAKTEILFTEVKQFKGRSHLTHKKIWIGVGLGAFLIFLGIIYNTTDGV